jgi:hypothetical protein
MCPFFIIENFYLKFFIYRGQKGRISRSDSHLLEKLSSLSTTATSVQPSTKALGIATENLNQSKRASSGSAADNKIVTPARRVTRSSSAQSNHSGEEVKKSQSEPRQEIQPISQVGEKIESF